MIHSTPERVPMLFAQSPVPVPPPTPPPPPPPKNDAAPGETRASAKDETTCPQLIGVNLTPPARRNAPPGTSSVAARRIAGQSKTLRALVLGFLVERGPYGATDDEGEAALGIRPQTYTPRRGELVGIGLVVDSGRRRPTGSGRPAAVWIAATFATIAPKAAEDAARSEGGAAC